MNLYLRNSASENLGSPARRAPSKQRLGTYDLTRDAWDTHQTLTRLGLMSLTAGEVVATCAEDGASRFRREPHRFDLDDRPLQQDAHSSMLAAVAALRDERLG